VLLVAAGLGSAAGPAGADGLTSRQPAADVPSTVLAELTGSYSTARAQALAARHDLRVVRHHPTIG